jgi:cyanophycinase-like exopeptidase
MTRIPRIFVRPISCLLLCGAFGSPASAKWKYFRAGNTEDSTVRPRGLFALMGGGEQDPAFKVLCEHANGGDFLILRANTEDDYAKKVNEDIRAMCPLNSVATIVFDDRENSEDAKIPEIITHAEVIFIAEGD